MNDLLKQHQFQQLISLDRWYKKRCSQQCYPSLLEQGYFSDQDSPPLPDRPFFYLKSEYIESRFLLDPMNLLSFMMLANPASLTTSLL